MLAELVKKLGELFADGAEVEFAQHKQLPRKVFVRTKEGTLDLDAEAPLRNHRLSDLQSLLDFTAGDATAPRPEVFFGDGAVTVCCDRLDRREFATLHLAKTTRWRKLEALAQTPLVAESKALIRFLRFELAAQGIDQLLAGIRKVDFTRTSSGKAHVEHGRESLGRSVEMAVQKAEDIPETFRIVVPIYATPGVQDNVDVQLGVEIDIEQQRFILRVIPDELERGIQAVQSQLRTRIAQALPAVPLFGGTF